MLMDELLIVANVCPPSVESISYKAQKVLCLFGYLAFMPTANSVRVRLVETDGSIVGD